MVVDIAAKGFPAFDNFMPDHHGDIDLDAHHYQARTQISISGACPSSKRGRGKGDMWHGSVLARQMDGVNCLMDGIAILKKLAGEPKRSKSRI